MWQKCLMESGSGFSRLDCREVKGAVDSNLLVVIGVYSLHSMQEGGLAPNDTSRSLARRKAGRQRNTPSKPSTVSTFMMRGGQNLFSMLLGQSWSFRLSLVSWFKAATGANRRPLMRSSQCPILTLKMPRTVDSLQHRRQPLHSGDWSSSRAGINGGESMQKKMPLPSVQP